MVSQHSLPRRLKAAVMLLLCVALSGTLLFSRLVGYAAEDPRHYIPLTRSGGITHVQTGTLDEQGSFHAEALYVPGRSPLLAASVDKTFQFEYKSSKASWKGTTGIELFRKSYDGTVKSAGSDKVIAPGTENSYTFALENTAKGDLDYTLRVTAEIRRDGKLTDESFRLPVEVKLTRDYDPKYLYGSKTAFADIRKLDVTDSGTLGEDKVMPYTLTWQWPFEGDDGLDTLLGSLGEDVTLTILIETTASYAPPTADAGGLPKTGDTSGIFLWSAVLVGSAAALLLLLLLRKGERNEKA